MPDFSARFSAGVTVAVWDDHAGAGASRINPVPTRPHHYYKAVVGLEVVITAKVGVIDAPWDDDLSSRLFSSDFAESPCSWPVAAVGDLGHSSIQRFTPTIPGHYAWCMRRAGGGCLIMHFDVEYAP